MLESKLRRLVPLVILATSLLASGAAGADAGTAGAGKVVLVDATTDAAWLAGAIAAYPMDTCVVSGDSLGEHSPSKRQDVVYREPGKPDRLVRFCCKGCVPDFVKDPQRYLRLIDEAAAKKAHS
jgi:hypothetical protein